MLCLFSTKLNLSREFKKKLKKATDDLWHRLTLKETTGVQEENTHLEGRRDNIGVKQGYEEVSMNNGFSL